MADKIINIDPGEIQPEIWIRLNRIFSQGKVGSAYLFAGPEGSGKEALAIEFAKLINCEDEVKKPCNVCPSCQRINVLQHENLTLVFPLPREGGSSGEDDPLKGLSNKTIAVINDAIQLKSRDPFYKIRIPRANTIPISVVRELRKSAYLKTAVRGRRIILIFDAHFLVTGEAASANALLKILEEPPAATSFILVSDQKGSLLPTILSRCQQIDFPPLADSVVTRYITRGNAKMIAGLSLGNMRLARKLADLETGDIPKRIETLARLVIKQDADNWREFVSTHSRLAANEPDEYRFNFYLLQLWFRAAYRQRMNQPDPLHENGLLPLMEQLNHSQPAIDYLGLNQALAKATEALARNYYIPLTLVNFLTTVQHRISGS